MICQSVEEFAADATNSVICACPDDIGRLDRKFENLKAARLERASDRSQTKASMLRKKRTVARPVNSTTISGSVGRGNAEREELAYTMDAARRAKQRKLERFIHTADLRMCDAAYAILKSSIQVADALNPCFLYKCSKQTLYGKWQCRTTPFPFL